MKIFSSEQTRAWDQYTIDNETIASIDLMERAAYKCSYWLLKKFDKRLMPTIFCGVGNNGGDGLAIARHLSERGYTPRVYIVNFSDNRSKDFSINFERLHAREIPVYEINNKIDLDSVIISDDDIIIDAIFGSGLSRPAEGISELVISKINCCHAKVIAIDLPSGMFNKIPGDEKGNSIVKADFTLSFESLKLPFLFKETGTFTGIPVVLSIGLHQEYYRTTLSDVEVILAEEIKERIKKRVKFTHKGSYGHSMIIAGSYGKMGAAVLCAKACLKIGSGLVTVHAPTCGINILQSSIPEAMVLSNAGEKHLTGTLEDIMNTIAIGPGIGQNVDTESFMADLLSNMNKRMVIDADALNIISRNPELRVHIPQGSILTPHPKEFERLVGEWKSEEEKIQKLCTLSSGLKSYILLKGAYSVVASPNGKLYFNSTGNAGMATAGSGDVLTGVITGLLAQGYSPLDSAVIGMYIHGLAGDFAAEELGLNAIVAGDIINFLSKAILYIQRTDRP